MLFRSNLLYAIEVAGQEHRGYSAPAVRIVTEGQFQDVVNKTKKRVRFANTLVPVTRYEISLAGHFPVEKFEKILERLAGIVLLVVGSGKAAECGPVMLDPRDAGKVEAWGRDKLVSKNSSYYLFLIQLLIKTDPRLAPCAMISWSYRILSAPDYTCHATARTPPLPLLSIIVLSAPPPRA